MTAFVVEQHGSFDFLSPEYGELYARSDATLFQHPLWLHHLYRTLAPTRGAARLVVTARDARTGQLALVLPLLRRTRFGIRRVELADMGVCDYVAAVADPAAVPALARSAPVADGVQRASRGGDLLCVDKARPTALPLAPLLGTGDLTRQRYATHVVPLRESFEEWRAEALAPEFARHLDRKRKRLRPKGELRLSDVTDPAAIDVALERMRDFRRARFAERPGVDPMQHPDYFDFYRAVAHDGARLDGPVRTSVLTVGGEIVAASLGLADAEQHLFLLVGYDVERLRNYSLGLLIVEELIRQAIERGRRAFDLTIGDEAYKADFGASPSPVYCVREPLTLRGRVAQAVADREPAARRRVKQVLQATEQRRADSPTAALAHAAVSRVVAAGIAARH